MATFSWAVNRLRVFLGMGEPPLEIVAYSSGPFFPFRLKQDTLRAPDGLDILCLWASDTHLVRRSGSSGACITKLPRACRITSTRIACSARDRSRGTHSACCCVAKVSCSLQADVDIVQTSRRQLSLAPEYRSAHSHSAGACSNSYASSNDRCRGPLW